MSKIPVIADPSNIKKAELEGLMRKGFAFVKIPGYEQLSLDIAKIRENASGFFRQDLEKKNELEADRKTFAGYKNREGQILEQFYCRPSKLIGPHTKCEEAVNHMSNVFLKQIEEPIMQWIFKYFNVEERAKQYKVMEQPLLTMGMSYYAEEPSEEYEHGMTAHKDYGYITVLDVNKKGLQFWLDGKWEDVTPEPGYAVVLLGNALELALDKKTASGLHRVVPPKGERLTLALFHDNNLARPFHNLITGEKINDKYSDYLAKEFSVQYDNPEIHQKMVKAAQEHIRKLNTSSTSGLQHHSMWSDKPTPSSSSPSVSNECDNATPSLKVVSK